MSSALRNRVFGAALFFAVVASATTSAQGRSSTVLSATPFGGILAGDHLFADRARLAFSPDGSFICLADRFGRSVIAVDREGTEIWRVDMPAGREIGEFTCDAVGRLILRPRGRAELWIYDQPSTPPRILRMPAGWPADGRCELERVGSEVIVRVVSAPIRFRIVPPDSAFSEADTLAAPTARIYANGPRGAFWFYQDGDRRLRGGRGGKDSIRLDGPLPPNALLAVGPGEVVWILDPARAHLNGYTPNGLPHGDYGLDPSVLDPVGFWIDASGAFWVADRATGRYLRYAP